MYILSVKRPFFNEQTESFGMTLWLFYLLARSHRYINSLHSKELETIKICIYTVKNGHNTSSGIITLPLVKYSLIRLRIVAGINWNSRNR